MPCALYNAVTVTGYNVSPPPDDGSEVAGNVITWQFHLDKLGGPLKTAIESMNTNILAFCSSVEANFTSLLPYESTHAAAYLNVNQALTQNVWTKVTFDTEEYDIGNNFTGGTYTVPSTGRYFVSASVLAGVFNDQDPLDAMVYKNGVAHKSIGSGDTSTASTDNIGMASGTIIDAVALDTIEVYARVEDASINAIAGQTNTYISIARII